jgi:ABC-type molybdate transport system substrate-binding protein
MSPGPGIYELYGAKCPFLPTRTLIKGHSNIGAFLKTQATDAGIMWNGVAHTFKDSLNIVKTPYEYDVAFQSLTVNELGTQIQAGSLDAVIAWDAIARYYNEYGTELPIPVEENVISTVNIGILSFTKNRSLAEQFVKFTASRSGQGIFKHHNYRTEPP